MRTQRIARAATTGSVALALVAATFVPALASTDMEIAIPYETFRLDNGLTVVVHEDPKAPIVAVNVWYHVGSKNEKPGRTGFAHLFEHLMFNGSEHFDDDYFKATEKLGATTLNGTTNRDRTNYFQNVPSTALDSILWLESDRMGHLLGAITQDKLDEQRGVVQNEKRQGENQPYGQVFNLVTEATWPEGHPYSWTVIGSMEDLDAASVDDVHEWFKTYYGPNNAVISIAGDVTVDRVRDSVERYFGDIPPGPPIAKFDAWIAKRSGTQRQTMQDRVPAARIYKVWNVDRWGSEDATLLQLAGSILSNGKTSRLYKRLVYEDRIASSVAAFVSSAEIAGQFQVVATAKPGEDLGPVEAAVEQELARFLEAGPTREEVDLARTRYLSSFVRGIETIGGFGGKSDILAQGAVYRGDPGYYRTLLDQVRSATPEKIRDAARRWLADGVYALEVVPFEKSLAAVATDVDREAGMPASETPPAPKFPALERATLPNGLEIVLAERGTTPVVEMQLVVDAGYSADSRDEVGLASMVATMLDEGAADRTALEISDELARLGAQLGSGAGLDTNTVSLSALTANLDASLDLFADVVLEPSFPKDELERLRAERIAQIESEKANPISIALRVFPPIVYGKDHAYGIPLTGSGTAESVSTFERDDLERFHSTWFRPNNATLAVVGPVSMDALRPRIERLFGDWERADVPAKEIDRVDGPKESVVYVIDRPGSVQSLIIAGHLAPEKANPNELEIETVNDILGGSFVSRLNLNLREDKSWSYGARTLVVDARGQRPFIAYAPVQSDKTAESMVEIVAELRGIAGDDPPSADELARIQTRKVLALPGSRETNGAVLGEIVEMLQFGYPADHFDTYPERLRSLSAKTLEPVAKTLVKPDAMTWIVVGDRAAIEPRMRELGFTTIREIDPDGRPVGDRAAGTTEGGGAGRP